MNDRPLIRGVAALAAAGLWLAACAAGLGAANAQTQPVRRKIPVDLGGPFDLAGERTPEVRYYLQETIVIHFGFDGRRTGKETYALKLRRLPAPLSGKGGDEYTVREFSVKSGDGVAETIPSLAGWSYVFSPGPTGRDEKGQVLGIPHARFENLTTSRGTKLSAIAAYPVYNSFIDFHAFCDVFARPTADGGGIQDLRTIGQEIVHASAFSEPPVNLGSGIKEGSVFRNGEVKLVFKGLSQVDGAACAVVGFDSGESTLRMIVPLGPDKDVVTVGGSEYLGDIFIELATRWVSRVRLDEFVVTETQLPGTAAGAGQKIPAYTVRHLLIRLISREEYEKG